MSEQERIILSVEFENDKKALREVMAIFPAENGHTYAALLPITSAGNAEPGAAIELVRATPCKAEDGTDDYIIGAIKSDMELDIARTAFLLLELPAPNMDTEKLEEETAPTPLPSLQIISEGGESQTWQIVDFFTIEDKQYAAMTLVDPLPAEKQAGEDISLFRVENAVQDGQEGLSVSGIPTEEEFENAKKVFENRLTTGN